MPAVIFAVAAAVGVEAIGVAAGTIAAFSWTSVGLNAALSVGLAIIGETASDPVVGTPI